MKALSDKKLAIVAALLLLLMVIAQIIAISNFTGEQISDASAYKSLAKQTAKNNSFYPNEDSIYSDYIFAPGYVNYLSLFYRVSDNDIPIQYGNMVLTVILVLIVYYIPFRLFKSQKIGLLSMILFLLFPTHVAEVLLFRTETLFTVLTYGALAAIVSDLKYKYVLAGVLMALGNFVRPLALPFVIATITYMILKKTDTRKYIAFISSIMIAVILLGLISYSSSGYFVFQSSTGGVNLIIGANDDADGSYEPTVFEKGNAGYIEDKERFTFKERDSYWTFQAVNWIKNNPMKYIALFPNKIFYMYSYNSYPFSSFYNNEKGTAERAYIINVIDKIIKFNFDQLTWVDFIVIINQAMYMLIFLMALLSVIHMVKNKKYRDENLLLLSIIILGTGMTILTLGGSRYHYPYMPVLCVYAAFLIILFADKKGKQKLSAEESDKVQ